MTDWQPAGTVVPVPPLTRVPRTSRGRLIAKLEAMTEDEVWEWAHSDQPEADMVRHRFGTGTMEAIRDVILIHPPGDAHALRQGLIAWIIDRHEHVLGTHAKARFMTEYARHTSPTVERSCDWSERRAALAEQRHEAHTRRQRGGSSTFGP